MIDTYKIQFFLIEKDDLIFFSSLLLATTFFIIFISFNHCRVGITKAAKRRFFITRNEVTIFTCNCFCNFNKKWVEIKSLKNFVFSSISPIMQIMMQMIMKNLADRTLLLKTHKLLLYYEKAIILKLGNFITVVLVQHLLISLKSSKKSNHDWTSF